MPRVLPGHVLNKILILHIAKAQQQMKDACILSTSSRVSHTALGSEWALVARHFKSTGFTHVGLPGAIGQA